MNTIPANIFENAFKKTAKKNGQLCSVLRYNVIAFNPALINLNLFSC